jgi:hypothetical protein
MTSLKTISTSVLGRVRGFDDDETYIAQVLGDGRSDQHFVFNE